MQAEFDAAMAEKARLEEDAATTRKRMDSANALIAALAGEEARWTAQSAEFAGQIQRLTGDCALAASFVSYLGPFNKEFRELLLARDFTGDLVRAGVPCTTNLAVSSFLCSETERGEWTLQGLPTDDLSVQNGIMVTRATRYPVLVDPQGQGLTWLRKREEANGLRVTSLSDKHFRSVLEDCLSSGKSMLVENIEEDLDPLLDPVLERRYIRKGKSVTLLLGDKEIDFDDRFAVYFTTRLPNPHYSPELSAKVTAIDFTVTTAGLEDQLLNRLILKEKAELEEQRKALVRGRRRRGRVAAGHALATALGRGGMRRATILTPPPPFLRPLALPRPAHPQVEEVTAYKRKIKQLEDDLLFRLSNSTGNLLDDTELVDVLAVTKRTAQEVNERLTTASETNKKITEACEEFRPVARRATLIYFLIAEFSTVNCMYQTSLAQFMALYEAAIDRADKAAMPSKRIANIVEYLTYSVYLYVQRGLFERHKLIFALMLANKARGGRGGWCVAIPLTHALSSPGGRLRRHAQPARPLRLPARRRQPGHRHGAQEAGRVDARRGVAVGGCTWQPAHLRRPAGLGGALRRAVARVVRPGGARAGQDPGPGGAAVTLRAHDGAARAAARPHPRGGGGLHQRGAGAALRGVGAGEPGGDVGAEHQQGAPHLPALPRRGPHPHDRGAGQAQEDQAAGRVHGPGACRERGRAHARG